MGLGGDLIALYESFLITYFAFVALWVPDCFSGQGTGSRKETVGSKIGQLWEGGGKNPQLCVLLGNLEDL